MKIIFKSILGFLLIVFCLAGLLTLTTPGLYLLATAISSAASKPEQTIEINGISGIWSGNLKVEQLRISDGRGAWLDISDVKTSWQPAKLLTGAFVSSGIHVRHLNLLHQPPATKPEPEPEESSGLPVSIDLKKITVNELAIGPEVMGTAARLKVNSHVTLNADLTDTNFGLEAIRIDDTPGSLAVVAIYQPEKGRIVLDANLSEGANGLLANALQIENAPAVTFAVSGKGSLENWNFSLAAKVDNRQVLDVDGTLSEGKKKRDISINGVGQPKQFLPPVYRNLVGEVFDLELDVTQHLSGQVQVSKAKLDFERFFLAATGDYDPAGRNQITGGFQVRDGGLEIPSGVIPGLKQLIANNLAFSVTGNGENARIDILADIPLIDTGDMRASNVKTHFRSPDYNLTEQTGALSADITIGSLTSKNHHIQRALGGSQSFSANGRLGQETLEIDSLKLSNPSINAEAKGSYQIAEASWIADIQSSVISDALPEELGNVIRKTLVASA